MTAIASITIAEYCYKQKAADVLSIYVGSPYDYEFVF
jgi:uncharacterized protein YycO